MKNYGLVSVILPTHNRAEIVSEAIESVLRQTYPYFELLVIDDGSVDDTEAVVKKFIDDRMIYRKVEHGGVSRARNYALKMMKGQYVAFIDSDDIYMPEKLHSQVEYLAGHPEIMVAYSPYIEIHRGKEIFHPCKKGDGNLFFEMFKGSFVNVNTILARRECADEAGGFPEGFKTLEDYDFFLRLAEKFSFGYVEETSSVYRMSARDEADDTANYVHYINYIRSCPEKFETLKSNIKVYNWKYGKVLFGLGKSHFRAGRFDESKECIKESLKYRWQPDVALFLLKNRKKFRNTGK